MDEGNPGEELKVEKGGKIVMGWGKINKLKIKTQEKTFILRTILNVIMFGRMSIQMRTNCNGIHFLIKFVWENFIVLMKCQAKRWTFL